MIPATLERTDEEHRAGQGQVAAVAGEVGGAGRSSSASRGRRAGESLV